MPEESGGKPWPPGQAAAGWSMDLPADPLALRQLRVRLRDWLQDLGASVADCTDLELAVWEAAVNAIVHGRPAAGPATVTVRAALDDAGRAVIQVSDRGRWRPDRRRGSGPGVARRAGIVGHQAGHRRGGHRHWPGRDHGDDAPCPQPPGSG